MVPTVLFCEPCAYVTMKTLPGKKAGIGSGLSMYCSLFPPFTDPGKKGRGLGSRGELTALRQTH